MDPREDLSLSDYKALAEFRYQLRRFLRFSEDAAREAGLEPQHHQLMLAAKGCSDPQGPRIAYLADRLQIQHHSTVELVDRLTRKGLITRRQGAVDRREVHVRLTTRGERILAELTRHTHAELRLAAPTLVATLRNLTAGGTARKPSRPPRRRIETLETSA